MNKSARLLSLMMLTALVAGCGGGGGDAGGTPPPPPPPASTPPPPPAPTQAGTGMSAPTLELIASNNPSVLVPAFTSLAQQMVNAYVVADEAAAAQQLATLAPGLDGSGAVPQATSACPDGGEIKFAPGTPPANYEYVGCAIDPYVFGGDATLTTTATGYRLAYSTVVASGASAPSDLLNGTTTCAPTATAANCVTTLGSFRWGYDVAFANGVANGTHQCTCINNKTWNVVFKDFGATSGVAYVYAINGDFATATRTGANSFTVQQTVSGVASPAVSFTL